MTTTPDTPSKKEFPAIPIALAIVTLMLIFFVIWRLDTNPGTDDAYAYADTIDVVPEVSGKIIQLPIKDNQAVKKGDLLFEIDPRPYQNALNEARASLVELNKKIELKQRSVNSQKYAASAAGATVKSVRAAAEQAMETLNRMAPLLADGYVSAEAVDQARTIQKSSKAALEAVLLESKGAAAAVGGVDALVAERAVVEAKIAIAELKLEFTKVHAPFDGRVVTLDTSEGQYASPHKPVCTLIDTGNWYVVANFRESEIKNIYPGTQSTVYLMADTDEKFQGTVDSIGYGVHPDDGGSTSEGLPKVERSVNWVRVAQRFPVKILVDNPAPELFRIGASAVVTLHSHRKSHIRKLAKNTPDKLPEAAADNNKDTMGNTVDKQEQAIRAALARSKAPAVTREMDVLSITFNGDESFDVNSSILKPAALDEINRVAGVLNQYPETAVLVAGHTDSTGGEDANRRLSERRAESVKYALVSCGVSPMRVVTMGYGEARSIASNDTAGGRKRNRRVEIRIQPLKGI